MFRFVHHYTDPSNSQELRFDVHSGMWKHISPTEISQAYGIIINSDKQILLVHNNINNTWQLPGGSIEAGESPKQALIREVLEEANVELNPKSIKQLFYQKVLIKEDEDYILDTVQVRFLAIVSKINLFEGDPDGTIDRIQWTEVDNLQEELKWGPTTNLIKELLN
jgi:8-oxo-dGTP pyrophosphatase MutT (NUDIX family)